jgi:hypothetical protein
MSTGGKPIEERSNVGIWMLVSLVLIVIGLMVLGGYLEIRFLKDWQDRSHFGEMFGSLHTLFSGLAFAGVIYTILLQRHELELQRGEVRRSAAAQAKSERIMALTAKLSALNSLVEATSRKLVDMKGRRDPAEYIGPVNIELEAYLRQVKSSLDEMNGVAASEVKE